jgi:hypothetical protein
MTSFYVSKEVRKIGKAITCAAAQFGNHYIYMLSVAFLENIIVSNIILGIRLS